MISCLGLGRKKKRRGKQKDEGRNWNKEGVQVEQKQERGKGKKDVEPWGIGHATAGDAAFSGTPANLMDMNSPLVPCHSPHPHHCSVSSGLL